MSAGQALGKKISTRGWQADSRGHHPTAAKSTELAAVDITECRKEETLQTSAYARCKGAA
jgi:hypothetical protein